MRNLVFIALLGLVLIAASCGDDDYSRNKIAGGDCEMYFKVESGKSLDYYTKSTVVSVEIGTVFDLPVYLSNIRADYDQAQNVLDNNLLEFTSISIEVQVGWEFCYDGDEWRLNGKTSKEWKNKK